MSEPWVVLKFGGTSVADKQQWETIARLVRERREKGYRVLVVCSALAGVTDALESLAYSTKDPARATAIILDQHARLAAGLGIDTGDLLPEGRTRMEMALAGWMSESHPSMLAELLSSGEWLSTQLGRIYLAQTAPVDWVDAREALKVLSESDPDSKRAWLSGRCAAHPDDQLASQWGKLAAVLITQGFVAAAPDGRTALLGRGGSDTSAALLAGRLGAERLEIWTDVPGLYSADPRTEPDARLIEELAYAEALEMAAGGARVVHGRSIRAAAESGLPILIRDINRPELGGTRISGNGPESIPGIRAITCQHNMLVLLLENLDTRQQVGFLAGVFDVVSRRGLSVDLVATSETTTTLAMNQRANHLDDEGIKALRSELSERCHVEVFKPCSCVNLVGRGARKALAKLGPAEAFSSNIPC